MADDVFIVHNNIVFAELNILQFVKMMVLMSLLFEAIKMPKCFVEFCNLLIMAYLCNM